MKMPDLENNGQNLGAANGRADHYCMQSIRVWEPYAISFVSFRDLHLTDVRCMVRRFPDAALSVAPF